MFLRTFQDDRPVNECDVGVEKHLRVISTHELHPISAWGLRDQWVGLEYSHIPHDVVNLEEMVKVCLDGCALKNSQ